MSGGIEALSLKEEDVVKLLAAHVHIGSTQVDWQMEQYVFKRNANGVHILNLNKTWEKLMLAARAIAAIENPADVCVISSRQLGQRAVLKYAFYTGATPIAGKFTPGSFTNQIQSAFREPRLLVVSAPRVDHQPVTESSYVNIPVIAFGDSDSPCKFVDIVIPGNNKNKHAIGLLWWMLAREVLRLRGTIPRDKEWEVMPDLFFFREPEDVEKEEAVEAPVGLPTIPDSGATKQTENWGGDFGTSDWAADSEPVATNQQFASDWSSPGPKSDWSAQPAASAAPGGGGATQSWGGSNEQWN